jgi:pilus assembly protein Flp/PilA
MADIQRILTNAYLRALESVVRGFEREEGQGLVEYGLILVLIAIVVIVILSTVGKRVNNVFSNISEGLGS